MNSIEQRWFGLTEYSEGLALQHSAWQRMQNEAGACVIGLEHPAVITLGKRGNINEDVVGAGTLLKDREGNPVKVVQIDRGGQATLHSPGQLVIYPILRLENFGLNVREFVELLHTTSEDLLKNFEMRIERKDCGPGLFFEGGKITSVGIRVDQGVTRHGIAINVFNDLSLFHLIRPCGMSQSKMASMGPYAEGCSLEQLFNLWCRYFWLNLKPNLDNYRASRSSLGAVGSAFP